MQAAKTLRHPLEPTAQPAHDLQHVISDEPVLAAVRHRHANDLNLIHSLLGLAQRRIDDARAAEVVTATRERVRILALANDAAWRAQSPTSAFDVQALLETALATVIAAHRTTASALELESRITPVMLSFTDAVALCLITRELVANALVHAFPDGRGKLGVELARLGDTMQLEVRDDGPGFPPDLDAKKQRALGLSLVEMLTEQLQGELRLAACSDGRGACCTVRFPLAG